MRNLPNNLKSGSPQKARIQGFHSEHSPRSTCPAERSAISFPRMYSWLDFSDQNLEILYVHYLGTPCRGTPCGTPALAFSRCEVIHKHIGKDMVGPAPATNSHLPKGLTNGPKMDGNSKVKRWIRFAKPSSLLVFPGQTHGRWTFKSQLHPAFGDPPNPQVASENETFRGRRISRRSIQWSVR